MRDFDFNDKFDKTVAIIPEEEEEWQNFLSGNGEDPLGEPEDPFGEFENTVEMERDPGGLESSRTASMPGEKNPFDMTGVIDPQEELRRMMEYDPGIRGIASVCEIGKREQQQDSCRYCEKQNEEVFAVVADGIGSYEQSGEISTFITEYMADRFMREDIGSDLVPFITETNDMVRQYMKQNRIKKAGSTVTALWIGKNDMKWLSVGDSKIFLFRDRSLVQLNREHNFGMLLDEQAKLGNITKRQAESHPKRKALVSYVGMEQIPYVDYSREKVSLKFGDRILIATDGIVQSLSENEITEILRDSAQRAAERIKEEIRKRDKRYQDNYAAVVIGF